MPIEIVDGCGVYRVACYCDFCHTEIFNAAAAVYAWSGKEMDDNPRDCGRARPHFYHKGVCAEMVRNRRAPGDLFLWDELSRFGFYLDQNVNANRKRAEEDARTLAGQAGYDNFAGRVGSPETRRPRRRLSPRTRYEVLSQGGQRCAACGNGPANGYLIEVDHIIPVSEGGTNDPENLQVLCWQCNRGKGAQLPAD
jgi:hypothetical protein